MMRALLVGEGALSHGSFLRRLAEALSERDDITAAHHVIEAPDGLRARLIAYVPLLGGADLQPLRWRLRYSWCARRVLGSSSGHDVALINTQACALLAASLMATTPTVISVDVTGRQFDALEYWRPRSRAAVMSELPLRALERRALRRATTVLAWTDWTARSLREDYGIPDERIAVVHPGLDDGWWQIERAPASDDRLRLLFVGDDMQRKGMRTLLDALPLIDRPVQLHVVTRDGDDHAGRPDVVVHRGIEPDSEALWQRFADADAFVLPTMADAVPWVVAEAMAAGLPVVASAVGAIPSMLGDAGITFPVGDAPALATAIRRLADDEGRRHSLGDAARERATDLFAPDRQLDRLVEVLLSAGNGSHDGDGR